MRFSFSAANLVLTVVASSLAGFTAGAFTAFVMRAITYCGIQWGDVATWVSALATVAATIAALLIALWTPISQRAAAAARSAERATTVAMALSMPLVMMRLAIKGIPPKIEAIRDRITDGGETSMARALLLHGAEKIPSGKDLEDLPPHFAATLVALAASAYAHNEFVERFASTHHGRADRRAFIQGIPRLVESVERMVDRAEHASSTYLKD